MSKFTPLVKFETSFEEDEITMNLRRLKRVAFMSLTPYLTSGADGTVDEVAMMDVATELLPDYVQNFKGLVDAKGEEIALEDMIVETYFIELITEIIKELFDISKIGKTSVEVDEAEKNSEGQPVISRSETVLSEAVRSASTPARTG